MAQGNESEIKYSKTRNQKGDQSLEGNITKESQGRSKKGNQQK